MKLGLLQVACWVAIVFVSACASVGPTLPVGQVQTAQGIVQGNIADGIISWRGIEYARAQRWKLPQRPLVWSGVRVATTLGPSCPQAGQSNMVEDCLFVNVFSPEVQQRNEKRPVLVWFHGGGFRAGSGGDSPRLWAKEGLVTVSFNYRLGVLGFRDWPGWDQTNPRNFGQADMVEALKWVRENIAAFGGDPNNVTIHGHSAGGMAVALMLTDPRAKGLFRSAIADASYGAWPFPKAMNPTPEMRQLMRYPNLETDATLSELVAKTPFFHLPIVGGSDLKAQPQQLLDENRARLVPTIFGFTSFDGGGTLSGAGYNPETFLTIFDKPSLVQRAYESDFTVSSLQGAERAFGDRRYGVSSRLAARSFATSGNKAWLFHVTGPINGEPGVRHGAYYRQMFGEHATKPLPLGQYFLNFVKSGDPNKTGLPLWSPYQVTSDNWMVFDPLPTVANGVLREKFEMWEAINVSP